MLKNTSKVGRHRHFRIIAMINRLMLQFLNFISAHPCSGAIHRHQESSIQSARARRQTIRGKRPILHRDRDRVELFNLK